MSKLQALDLRTAFPRSGRSALGGYAWLARIADKARAEEAGTGGEYIAYCPLSLGWLERIGISREDFHARIRAGASDGELVDFLDERATSAHKAAANRFIMETMASHLDEQDAEEGRAA